TIFSFFLLLIVIAAFFASMNYEGDSRIFPQIVCVSIGILLVIELIKQLKNSKDQKGHEGKINLNRGFLKVLISLPLFILLIYVLGFFIASAICLIGLPILLGKKELKVILISGAVLWTGVFFLFKLILNVPFPQGLFGM